MNVIISRLIRPLLISFFTLLLAACIGVEESANPSVSVNDYDTSSPDSNDEVTEVELTPSPEPTSIPEPIPIPEPLPVADIGAPTLDSVSVNGMDIILEWSQAYSEPAGGYDVHIDGANTGSQYRTTSHAVVISGLDIFTSYCFFIESRYTQTSEFFSSNELCSQPVPEPSNAVPVIDGVTDFIVDEEVSFSFTPTASDADGDLLSFLVANLPTWAAFDSTTGTISGTPLEADVGTYSGIEITVSDGSASAVLSDINITVNGVQPPPAPVLATIAGYAVYIGDSAETLAPMTNLQLGSSVEYTSSLSGAVTYYFAVIAKDESDGILSGNSEIGGYRVRMGSSSDALDTEFDLSNGPNGLYWLSDTDIQPGTYFLSISAYDLNDNEAAASNLVQIQVM